MNTKKTRIALIAVLSLSAIAIATAYWSLRLRNGSLIYNAHRIGKLEGQTNLYTPTPEWISDHEAIFLSYHAEGDRFEFNRLNTSTGLSSPIVGLNERYVRELVSNTYNVRSVPHPAHIPPDVSLSPAHDLLLVSPPIKTMTFGLPAHYLAYPVTDLSGSRDIAWNDTASNQYNFFPPLWLSDDNRWLMSGFPGSDMRASVYSVRSPRIHTDVDSINTGTFPWGGPLHTTHEGQIWGFTQKSFGSPINIRLWDIGGTSSPESFNVLSPVNGRVWKTALSMENDRVAWLITYWYVSPISQFRHRLKSSRPILKNSSNTFGIWVSDLHGNHMQELGHEQFSRASIFSDGYMRWLPGGKKLAFHIGGDLYTIDVDR